METAEPRTSAGKVLEELGLSADPEAPPVRARRRAGPAVTGVPAAELPEPGPLEPVHCQRIYATGDQAARWLLKNWAENRNIREWRVLELMAERARGCWVSCNLIMFVLIGEQEFLLNGQHTLEAIVRDGKPCYLPVAWYRVTDKEQAELIYGLTDQPIVRTTSDSMPKGRLRDELGASDAEIKLGSAAAALIMAGFSYSAMDDRALGFRKARTKVAGLKEWYPEIAQYLNLIRRCPARVGTALKRQSVMAVALVTLRHQPEKAVSFWRDVAQSEHLTRSSPEYRTRELLADQRTWQPGGGSRRFPAKVAQFWNLHYHGAHRMRVADREAEEPEIAGTPYRIQR